MSKKIQIEVPDEFHEMLEEQAAAEGKSLSDVVKLYLGVPETALSFEELAARRKARGPSERNSLDTVRTIREGRGE